MYTIGVHTSINRIFDVFHLFGMQGSDDVSNSYRKAGWKLCHIIVLVCFGISLVSGGLLSDDKNEFVFLITSGVIVFNLTVKLLNIWKKDEINAFVLDICVHSVADFDEFTAVSDRVKKFMKLSYGFVSLIFIAYALCTVGIPLFSGERSLCLNIWSPLDWKDNLVYYWIVLAFISTALLICLLSILLNVIIWYLMMNCAIKYQILGNQFRNMALLKPTIKKKKITETEKNTLFQQEFVGLIKTHQNIQGTINRFKSCFANLFFVQITTSGLCICGSVYALTFGANDASLMQVMLNAMVIIYCIFDILMVMYLGNEIKLSSDRLSYCLFEANWIELSVSSKKYIIILTEVLKQPHELVIAKLYPMNLETFTSIVNLAYSMFNILKNLN